MVVVLRGFQAEGSTRGPGAKQGGDVLSSFHSLPEKAKEELLYSAAERTAVQRSSLALEGGEGEGKPRRQRSAPPLKDAHGRTIPISPTFLSRYSFNASKQQQQQQQQQQQIGPGRTPSRSKSRSRSRSHSRKRSASKSKSKHPKPLQQTGEADALDLQVSDSCPYPCMFRRSNSDDMPLGVSLVACCWWFCRTQS